MATHSNPKRNGYLGNICGFCKYFGADVKLTSRSVGGVEFDGRITGRCLAVNGVTNRKAETPACNKFELSYEAGRFAK